MYANRLTCRSCGAQLPLELQYACPHCGGILEVQYDYDALVREGRLTRPELPGLWKYLPPAAFAAGGEHCQFGRGRHAAASLPAGGGALRRAGGAVC